MPVSRNRCIFLNVGLGEAAKRNVGTGSGQIPDMSSFASALSSSGYQKLPSGLIIQWGRLLLELAALGYRKCSLIPVAFPRYCAQIITSYDNGSSSIIAGAAGNQTTTQFLLRCGATGGSYNFRWLAVGINYG
ncbi:hypothetical protein DMI66_25210 [Escherichia coli]|nr:hypothetical protein [Escherichia coli]